jgi:hypothetical protein
MDLVTDVKTVMFVGEYFTLITTVSLEEKLRNEGELDEDFAIRIASAFMKDYYGFDVESFSNNIGIVEE